MSSGDYRRLHLELRIRSDRTELLEGLENWLSLGLITEEEVRRLCQAYLTCALPVVVAEIVTVIEPEVAPVVTNQLLVQLKPAIWVQVWQSFKAEISVRWLLLLGIFLVVVSSVVLAASAWQDFSPTKQYILLYIYTLAFWGTGIWTSRISNLPLTAQTLQTLSLLLIPVNFWAMDTLGLWTDFEGIITMAIASVTLTGICLWQNRSRYNLSSSLNFLTLSYLHWGWSWLRFPVIAIYVGGIITFLVLQFLSPRRQIGVSLIIYCFLLILARGIFVAQIPLNQLGLVIAVMGWLIANEKLQQKIKRWSPVIGFSLILVALIVTVTEKLPWQGLIVLIIALEVNFSYLRRYWQKRYVLVIFLLGLQGFFVIARLIPQEIKSLLQRSWAIFHQALNSPVSDYSFSLLIYLAIFLVFTDWLYRQNQTKIGLFGERLSLGLGLVLSLIASSNPVARSLNLVFSTITLIILAYRRRGSFRVYFAHIVTLIAIVAILDCLFPDLTLKQWIIIFLGMMTSELILSTRLRGVVSESCWWLGLSLGIWTYLLLFEGFLESSFSLVWLIMPVTLTGIIPGYPRENKVKAALFSSIAVILVQGLAVWQFKTRLLSLIVGTVLMGINYRFIPNQYTARIHWGLILGLVSSLLSPLLRSSDGWLVSAIALLLLWLIPDYTRQRYPNYSQAADFWGTVLSITLLVLVSLTPQWQVLGGIGIMIIAFLERDRRHHQPILIFGVAWLIEIALVTVTEDILSLAVANVIVGLLSLTIRDWLRSKNRYLALLPLFYAGIGFICRLDYFTPYTGLLTIGIALTGVGVGSLRREWKTITILSMVGISLGVYEILLYFLWPISPEEMAKQLTLLALATAGIAVAYRIGSKWVEEVKIFAHIHWAIAGSLQLLSVILRLHNPWNILLALVLSAYALIEGRDLHNRQKNWWVYAGIIQISLVGDYLPEVLNPVKVILACIIAGLIYQIPWQSWGWQSQPWHRSASIIPAFTALISNPGYWNLLAVALFYLQLGRTQQIRWTYLSLGFANWAIARWLIAHNYLDLIWYVSLVGLSINYVATVDPWLQLPSHKRERHYLRLIGTGIIALVALLLHQETGITPAILGLLSVFLGLALKIRAFLYVGTLSFTLTIFYQLVVLSVVYSFLKWILGLIIGVALISIAANFERRRDQIVIVWQQWLTQLEQWE
ncbi:hypothetical protein [Gloeocapsa sp. PCC 73106]|uniref:hypothetical protein n=1 Tax=Gloeocapsa sp. PCC 73106 TaxID=102232 RepID=UPI0002ABE8F4|nr:hypothetical protein [Gloeocapsa sp. PCC 73106]ELR96816.1 hypothetical protein GLO73106DRAFT_00006150 [Gloeocapsa sp. PCC 73106]